MKSIALILCAIVAGNNDASVAGNNDASVAGNNDASVAGNNDASVAGNNDAASRADDVQFHRDIVPILTKAGCNGGGCHGAAAGRGGLHLSLYGSDPRVDFRAIVRQLGGRRVNLAKPDESLVLLKPTGQVDHEGGYRFAEDSPSGKLLEFWIRHGAEQGPNAQLKRLEVTPQLTRFQKTGQSQKLTVVAHFADGTTRDVSQWTVFNSSSPSALSISANQIATVHRRGRQVITARYLDQVAAIETILPWRDEAIAPSNLARHNFIDDRVNARLRLLSLPTAPTAGDEQFLRRVFLDLTGRLPTPQQSRRFQSDKRPGKHAALIDTIMKSEAFVDYWTFWMANVLRLHSNSPNKQGVKVYHSWLRRQWMDATPYDQIARQLLTAIGDSHKLGPPNFSRTASDARDQAELVSEVFLGVRLRCANCHDHPLDHWKQDDYHGLAAVFAKLDRGQVVKLRNSGEVTHPRTGTAAIARIPGERNLTETRDNRIPLANWVTSRKNPYFAQAIANRIWKHFMGRGLVEPVDDIRDTNPPTHPELLKELANHLCENDFDLRSTIKLICSSAAYRRSSTSTDANHFDELFYSHMPTKPLGGEVLADIISDVTGKPNQYSDHPKGTRAIQLVDDSVPSKTLDLLGRCSRSASCESASNTGGLARQLHLINGKFINAKLTARDGRLQEMLGTNMSREQFVRDWYYRCLCRLPTAKELKHWVQLLDDTRDNREYVQALEDFVWSLLVCEEFVTNH